MLEAIARQTGCALPSRAANDRIGELLAAVEGYSRLAGMPVRVDASVITERAAMLGLSEPGAISANGKCRMIRAADGWLAVNLPRADDADLLPAWIGVESGDPWDAIDGIAASANCSDLVERGQLLGLAVAQVRDPYTAQWCMKRIGTPRVQRKQRPLVVDMSSLWAGPLCGALLAEAGAEVIKLESASRPDGARFGSPAFFARLNDRKRSVVLDLPRELDALRDLFARADVVIESARPRVFDHWGISLPDAFAANPHLIWASITAYGREGPRANWVGFGDEVAAAAGLVNERDGQPNFVGDAIADPLAGVGAAASAFAGLAAGGGFLIEANLFAAAAFVAGKTRS